MKQKPLHSANKSIRSRTLIYFMVMALSMITLLWAVQEWFFSTQYSQFKQREVTKILQNATDSFDWPIAPDYFSDIHNKVIENNMVMYFFGFKPAGEKPTEKREQGGETLYRLVGNFSSEFLLSPVTDKSDFYIDTGEDDDLTWSDVQQDRFVRMLGLADIVSEPTKETSVYDAQNQRLYYASCPMTIEVNGQTTYFYFYAEASVANNDVAIGIIRFEFMLLTVLCIILAFVFSVLLSSMLSSPITKISKRAEQLAKGNYDIDFGSSSIKEINNLAKTLSFAADEFSKTEQLRRDFIANISHDLRTPLTMVKAYAEMIRDMPNIGPEKRKQHAQTIVDEAERLSTMVGDIQKLSKIQAGTDAVALSDFDLIEFCAGVVRQFSMLNERFGVDIKFSVAGQPYAGDGSGFAASGGICFSDSAISSTFPANILGEVGAKNPYILEDSDGNFGDSDSTEKTEKYKQNPLISAKSEHIIVSADRDKISQVLYNLIGNAINYAGENKTVNVRVIAEAHSAIVEVEDNGKGIAEDELDAVWDRYYRANQVKRTVVGSGLGLSIVKSILVAHGAEYGVRSEPQKGTTFWFSLKIKN